MCGFWAYCWCVQCGCSPISRRRLARAAWYTPSMTVPPASSVPFLLLPSQGYDVATRFQSRGWYLIHKLLLDKAGPNGIALVAGIKGSLLSHCGITTHKYIAEYRS